MGRRHEEADGSGRTCKRKKKHPVKRLAFWGCVGLGVAAVVQELQKPTEDRTWTGKVAGTVPYDLRWPPTAERFRAALWNPGSDELITPHPFGVGWSVNFARIARVAQEAAEASRR